MMFIYSNLSLLARSFTLALYSRRYLHHFLECTFQWKFDTAPTRVIKMLVSFADNLTFSNQLRMSTDQSYITLSINICPIKRSENWRY